MAARLLLQPHRWVDPRPAKGTPVYRVHREGTPDNCALSGQVETALIR
jgi:hypothetical protein